MAAEVNATSTGFRLGTVKRLFEVRRRTQAYLGLGTGSVYDVTSNGERFLINVIADEQAEPPPITVITNWRAPVPVFSN